MSDEPSRRPPPDRRLLAFMLASFVVGAVLMVAFDVALTRVLGMVALVAFMVAGVFLVADPRFLVPDEDE
jgi:hypothetical protein